MKGLANKTENAVFNKALDVATKNRQGNQDYLDAFFIAFQDESKGNVPLASPDIFGNMNMDEVNTSMDRSTGSKSN